MADLHIGIDARELIGKPTGVGRFLAEMLKVWAYTPDATQYTLFVPAAPPDWVASLGPRVNVVVDAAEPAGTWWEQIRLPRLVRRSGAQVLLAPAYTMPLRLSCPAVVVIHDVSFFAHPEWFSWREGARRRWLTGQSARRARAVLTVSEFSAREIERYTGVPASNISIVRHGAPYASSPSNPSNLILFVGSLFNRRRLPEMIEGFALAARRVPGARLVLVGDNRTSPRQDPMELAARFGAAGQVEWRDYATDAELHGLYQAARAFVFLSDYEGFAMTPLEAIAHGVPPVLLDTAVAREVYGAAAVLVPPEPGAIAAALETVLTDEHARAPLAAEGARLLERYTWPRAAEAVLTALTEAARQ